MNKKEERHNHMENALKYASDEIEELLKTPSDHLEQLSQIYFIRVILIYWLVCHTYELNICFKILSVIKYVGLTPVVPNPPEANVLPVSKGLSDA